MTSLRPPWTFTHSQNRSYAYDVNILFLQAETALFAWSIYLIEIQYANTFFRQLLLFLESHDSRLLEDPYMKPLLARIAIDDNCKHFDK